MPHSKLFKYKPLLSPVREVCPGRHKKTRFGKFYSSSSPVSTEEASDESTVPFIKTAYPDENRILRGYDITKNQMMYEIEVGPKSGLQIMPTSPGLAKLTIDKSLRRKGSFGDTASISSEQSDSPVSFRANRGLLEPDSSSEREPEEKKSFLGFQLSERSREFPRPRKRKGDSLFDLGRHFGKRGGASKKDANNQ